MASIRRVVHRTGRMSWQARWRDPAGAQHSKNFPRRIDAERFLTTVEARKLAGTYVDPQAGRIRLGDFTEQAAQFRRIKTELAQLGKQREKLNLRIQDMSVTRNAASINISVLEPAHALSKPTWPRPMQVLGMG